MIDSALWLAVLFGEVVVMRVYSDTSTRLLEEFALQKGVVCEIRKIEAHEDGRFFIVSVDDEPLKWPIAVGFTSQHARDSIASGRWRHFAVPGGPVTLEPKRSRKSSKRRSEFWS